jgi:outer membrane protein
MKNTLKSVKNVGALALMALMMFFGTTAHAQTKVGYLNATAILADMPEVKSADSQLQAFAEQMQKMDSIKVVGWQAKVREFQQKQQDGLISPKQAAEDEQKLKAEQAEIAKFEEDMNKQIQQRKQQFYQPILDKVNKAIQDIAKENAYTYIIDTASGILLYASETHDVTNLVRKKLGMPDKAPEKK